MTPKEANRRLRDIQERVRRIEVALEAALDNRNWGAIRSCEEELGNLYREHFHLASRALVRLGLGGNTEE